MTITELLLPEFDTEMANTRKVLERIPEDKFGWRAHAKSATMGETATHLVNMTTWVYNILDTDSIDFAPTHGEPPVRPTLLTNRQEMLARFDANVAAARARLAVATDDEYQQTWSMLKAGQVLFSQPKSQVLRSFVMNHTIHHRAQLVVSLRLNDVPLPMLYGPTADEQGM
ncbi:MAG TPA: DinB family protein [Armatimonadota bacterium]|jgi:uncharacterized damage-inducible protein DinB